MAWGRGLFRMWIVLSVIWCVLVGLLMWNSIANPYISWGVQDG
ncbi:hypothetical protein GGD56_003703 [Rhizobium mongolense]|uniref:Uncharacterized protein n=2 Tax=Rhizobium mongolense TaxID=57676 RepID=A0ABR6IPP2_9HYPH|nr:hypothetical protein [Rhizobium mongolense]TVZ73001.1 hypothetical protein BCL32_1198 [Rhizobium mongolense USDA 1844]